MDMEVLTNQELSAIKAIETIWSCIENWLVVEYM